MALFDNVMNKITNAGQTTVQKAKDLSEVARLNGMISEAEKQISDLYGEIGYAVCRAYMDRPIPEAAELMEQVRQLHGKIEDCKEQIKTITAAGGCPQCGAKIVKGNAFCGECGYKFPEQPAAAAPQGSFCGNCGAALADGVAFCSSCGAKVE